jgi:hypothetical protein
MENSSFYIFSQIEVSSIRNPGSSTVLTANFKCRLLQITLRPVNRYDPP